MGKIYVSWPGRGDEEISKERFAELLAFCRQYKQREKRAAQLLRQPGGEAVHTVYSGGMPSDPTFRAVELREKLLSENALIDECLKAMGKWEEGIRQNMVFGVELRHIPAHILPTCYSNAFYTARKAFMHLLNEKR